jgi:hypothetical protein
MKNSSNKDMNQVFEHLANIKRLSRMQTCI